MVTDLPHVPDPVPNLVGGSRTLAREESWLEKHAPHDGRTLWRVTRSAGHDVGVAVRSAAAAQPAWAATPPVRRGMILHRICSAMEARAEEIAAVAAVETGKGQAAALGEVEAAVECGRFFAGEGQRLYGRTTTSRQVNKYAMTIRQPVGLAGLIIAANTPVANVAWKIFPALVCGNAAILKAAEDAPATAWLVAEIAHDAGLPSGVLNVVQGLGPEAGRALVEDEAVGVISFTGSTAVGRDIARRAAERLSKVSLELGGKNPLVVCDDADLDEAVEWSVLSAFSNAGQRCASGSRIIVFDAVYDDFRDRMLKRTAQLRLGVDDDSDVGPVINERAMETILRAIDAARQRGATVACGGHRLDDSDHAAGYYVAPTIIEDVPADDEMSVNEVFGPVTVLYRADDLAGALELANRSPYGLTASVHTKNWDRAMVFSMGVRSGVSVVNGGTYGSEPHMPFGGVGVSGNGTREPGTEALDVYSELKDLYLNVDPTRI